MVVVQWVCAESADPGELVVPGQVAAVGAVGDLAAGDCKGRTQYEEQKAQDLMCNGEKEESEQQLK